jgi:hypothetical protein
MGFKYELFGPGQDAILPSLLTQAAPSTATNQGLLGSLIGADLNIITDQPISINAQQYVVTKVMMTNASTDLTAGGGVTAGGIYTAPAKAGLDVVIAGYGWNILVLPTDIDVLTGVDLYGGAAEYVLTGGTVYLSLTTGAGFAATADIYIYGDRLA